MTADRRAHFDFTIAFANGGGMQGDGFRLDLPREDVSAQEIGALLIRHLGLALVSTVELHDLRIVEEPHRGSRGVDAVGDAVEDSVIDLSHPIEAGLVTYPGLPAPIITPYLTREDSRARYAPGTEFEMDVITMIGNTGTYLDAPFHRYADGGDLASLELRTLVGLPAEVFHLRDAWAPERRGIQATTLADRELHGAAVLLDTGWDRYFGRPEYASGAPFLTEDAARFLVDAGVRLVGIDSLNIDDTESGGERPAHSILLAGGVHVVEHLANLDEVPARGARFTAAPPAVRGFGTFPVRAFATVSAPH
ncbi:MULTISPECIES: cyclase family protein [unclassified Microbacterium]|uniref:cyclase family protein n=1 Tax=unclassified Microbacterium TaxID=2609290 RepID=UPI000CFB97B4|nr:MULTISPECIES: cyclase family protein [unclassified Microbacterium]PQZ53690.1 cyclase [Microbacterium sp. MYb43]PQZ76282.1 cyclase [Microbacterium sp. MYb40]PRB21393.1 cyclase [Microbacterium sp. MYb54]PRB29958.1 cyclase [Microbacterium sp. MYb50]PRB67883.1 cyclase [Microbacterium sp. MYb24]